MQHQTTYHYGPWVIVRFRSNLGEDTPRFIWKVFNQYGDGPFFLGLLKDCKYVIDRNEVPTKTILEQAKEYHAIKNAHGNVNTEKIFNMINTPTVNTDSFNGFEINEELQDLLTKILL